MSGDEPLVEVDDGSGPSREADRDFIPPRVDAALAFLHFVRQIEQPDSESAVPQARERSQSEDHVYDAALDLLKHYFRGGDPDQPLASRTD